MIHLPRLSRNARACLLCVVVAMEPCLHVFGIHTGLEVLVGLGVGVDPGDE